MLRNDSDTNLLTLEGDPEFHDDLYVAKKHSMVSQIILNAAYAIGILGNMAALLILQKEKKTRYRNKKHALMLTCLAGNDLVPLVGMLIQMHVTKDEPHDTRASCVFRVIWRSFGLSSGCVALVMAVERWLALTHPFLYQKRVTYQLLLKSILSCWAVVLVISIMPLFGFGLYYDPDNLKCQRYRKATEPKDIAYAYLIFVYGLMMCTGIAFANLAVTKYLCHSQPSSRDEFVGRRIRSVSSKHLGVRVECLPASTPEELAFARLMVALSITFLMCWIPNLVAIPVEQLLSAEAKQGKGFFEMADVLMALHFMLDPYIYVLLHHYFPCLRVTFETVNRHCCWGTREETILEESSSA